VFCEIHGELLGFGGKCSLCELNELPTFETNQKCDKCKISNFLIDEEHKISCGKCKEEYYVKESTTNTLLRTYTNIYDLYKRNYFQLPIWAEERTTGEKIFIVEVREKNDSQSNAPIPNGILVARYDRRGKKMPILENGARGKYRPIISYTGEYDNYITESNIGFLPSVEMNDWKQIDSSIKPPFDINNLDPRVQDEIDLFMNKYSNYTPIKNISAKQREYLIRLKFDGDWGSLNSTNISSEIERLKTLKRSKRK
jgi:ribosomal protein S27AE